MAFADPGKLLISEEAIMKKILTASEEGGGYKEDFPGSGSSFCLHNWHYGTIFAHIDQAMADGGGCTGSGC